MVVGHAATYQAKADLEADLQVFKDAELRALQPALPRRAYASLQSKKALESPGRQNLERFERALHFLFSRCGVKLGHLQIKLLHAARISLLRRMYGNDLVNDLDYLRTRFRISRIYENVSIIFPRRVGKTTVQTIVAACVAVSQFDGNVCCFNIKGRQARAWLSQAMKWLFKFQDSEEFKFTVENQNAQEFILIRNCTGTLARISSYPGTVLSPLQEQSILHKNFTRVCVCGGGSVGPASRRRRGRANRPPRLHDVGVSGGLE